MYKLVTIDLDGTLLNSKGEVSQYTKDILNDVMNKGTDIVIASGRPIDSIKNIAKSINSKNYFIAGNGATIYDIKNNQVIYESLIKKERLLEIIKICDENSIYYNIYTNNEIIASSLKYNVLYYFKENMVKEESNKTKINIVPDIYEYVKNNEKDKILKVTICDENKLIFNSIMKKMKKIKGIDILDVSHISRKIIKKGTDNLEISYFYTEITAKDTDKWNATEYLMKMLNVEKEEIIAIGDNMNDKKMIENAGTGIAMLGSTPLVTEIADRITKKTNDEDGVAEELKSIIL